MQGVPVIYGEVLFDCFEDGSRVLGGAPFNVAWNLQAFGAQPLFISRVGDDPLGREIRGKMQQWGMNTAGLQMDSAHPTGTVEVTIEDGEPSYEIVADRAYDHIWTEALPPVDPSLVYHGTLALRQPGSAKTLAEFKGRYDAPTFMDVNLRPPWWDEDALRTWLGEARWAKLNDQELAVLAGQTGNIIDSAMAVSEQFALERLIVTEGGKGAFAVDGTGLLARVKPADDTAVVDTVGAGDAFASVCILGLLKQWPVGMTLERAQAFASAIVGCRGATVFDEGFYQSFVRQWGV